MARVGRLSGSGGRLAEAGATQAGVVHQLALWLGVMVAAADRARLLVLAPAAVAWSREGARPAGCAWTGRPRAVRPPAGVVNRSLRELHKVTPDRPCDLRAGIRGLADLELRALGLRTSSRGG